MKIMKNDDHIKFFESQRDRCIRNKEKELYWGHEEAAANIQRKIECYQAAIDALQLVEEINRPDGWEG